MAVDRAGSRRLVLGGLIALVLLLTGIAPGGAAAAARRSDGVAASAAVAETGLDLLLSADGAARDIALTGANTRQDLIFPLYPHWQTLAGTELRLALRYSPLIGAERSALTVSLDGIPLLTKRLTTEEAGGLTLRVPIPPGALTGGTLNLQIAATLRTDNAACPDPADPGAWLVVEKESRLHLEYAALPRDLRLKDLPAYLLAGRRALGNRIVFALPPQPQPSDWRAASLIAAEIGEITGQEGVAIDVLPAGQQPDAGLGNAVLIYVGGEGLRERLAATGLAVAPTPTGASGLYQLDGQVVDNGTGLLAIAPATWSASGLILVVTGGSEAALLNAARALRDADRVALLQGATARIGVNANLPARPAPSGEAITLRQLGFADRTLYGLGTQALSYRFAIPGGWRFARDGELRLRYNYSRLVAPDLSALTVRLNDVGIGSAQLRAAGQVQELVIALPAAQLRNGDNTLEIQLGLHVTQEHATCGALNTDIWGTVYNQSALTLPYELQTRVAPDLAIYPYPFSGGTPGQPAARIVLPTDPLPAEQAAALVLVAGMGRFAGGADNSPLIVPAGQLGEAKGQADLLLLGGPLRNPLSKELNERLPIRWEGATARTLKTNWSVVFPNQDDGDLGLAQVVASPWNADRLVLDVGYSKPGLVGVVAAALGQQLTIGKYRGNVLVIDPQGRSYPLDTINRADTAKVPTAGAASTPTHATPKRINIIFTQLWRWLLALAIALALLSGILTLVAQRRRLWPSGRRRGR